jgi:hypothetical protein
MLMEDVLPAAHPSSMFLQVSHALLMDAFNTLLEDALNAIKVMPFFTTAANYPIALPQAMENALNVTLTIFSPPTESVSPRMSSVIKWMSMVPASSA